MRQNIYFPIRLHARRVRAHGRSAVAVVMLFVISACSPIGLINTLSPSGHYERVTNIPYGSHERHRLDLYLPSPSASKAPDTKTPVVFFFYGGGWKTGDKKDYEFVASSLTKAGYAVIIPDYRLFPEVVFPAFIHDAAVAVAWGFEHANAHGLDARNVYLMGHSAGAHTVAMLGTDARYLTEQGLCLEALQGVIGLSGPYDFLPINTSYLVDLFPKALRDASQPINFAGPHTPPTLLIHGDEDEVVKAKNSETLARLLREQGVDVELKVYEKEGHASVAAALAPPLDFTGDTLEDTLAFLNRTHRPISDCP